MMILTARQIVALHQQLIQETGGIHGIRDKGLLDAALHAPFQSFGGQELYPSIEQKAARLGSGLVQNHAFLDGNKPWCPCYVGVSCYQSGSAIIWTDGTGGSISGTCSRKMQLSGCIAVDCFT